MLLCQSSKEHDSTKYLNALEDFDLGKVRGLVKVDNVPIAKLGVVDYSTNTMQNVTEIYTKGFNINLPTNTHISTVKYGTWVVCLLKTASSWRAYNIPPKYCRSDDP